MSGLVLNIRLGRSVYLNDTEVKLTTINQDGTYDMKVMGEDGIYEVLVCEDRSTAFEVPGCAEVVYLQAGEGHGNSMRLNIRAPKDCTILRDELYAKAQEQNGYVSFSREAKAQMTEVIEEHELDLTIGDFATMVNKSGSYTAQGWNRRYGDFLFEVDGNKVFKVGVDI